MWNVIDLAELYAKGIPPLPGGSLNQMHWFNTAARMIWNETQYWKNKRGEF